MHWYDKLRLESDHHLQDRIERMARWCGWKEATAALIARLKSHEELRQQGYQAGYNDGLRDQFARED